MPGAIRLLTLTCGLFLVLAQGLFAQSRTVWEGVYASSQASRGATLFASKCRRCHSSESFSNAEALALKGSLFMTRWREDSVQNLFNRMKSFMPPSASGGDSVKLPDQEYLDILAFLMQSNEFPPGDAELSIEALPRVQITGRDGPQPVPSLATVKVIGCLVQAPNGRWRLTSATEPVRTREPEASTPAEISESGTRPLGALTFELRGIDTVGTFDPDSHKGDKLQVKGVLYREPSNRVSVLSVESVGANCGG